MSVDFFLKKNQMIRRSNHFDSKTHSKSQEECFRWSTESVGTNTRNSVSSSPVVGRQVDVVLNEGGNWLDLTRQVAMCSTSTETQHQCRREDQSA